MVVIKHESAMSAAASNLRAIISAQDNGAFLGGEGELQRTLGVSRTTLRQVARLLEREGLLTVRRGPKGGYFANRPSEESIEAAVITHLEILDVHIDELMSLAAITWIEALRHAATLRNEEAKSLVKKLIKTIRSIKADVQYSDLISAEQKLRSEIFGLIKTPFMKLIFNISTKFAGNNFERSLQTIDPLTDRPELVEAWRSIKLLELEAISLGDPDLAQLAAQRSRHFWNTMLGEVKALSRIHRQQMKLEFASR